MDIYSVIREDHRKVKDLLEALAEATEDESEFSGSKNERRLQEITGELEVHNQAEEEVFYARLYQSRKSRVLAIEGKREHELARSIMDELMALDGSSDDFVAKVRILKELVENHIKEEEGEVHSQAKKELSRDEAKELATQFIDRKRQLLERNGTSSESMAV